MLQALIFMRRYQFLHEGMRWFDTRRFGITVYRYLQLPADVIAAGLTPNPRK